MPTFVLQNFVLLALVFAWVESHDLDTEAIKLERKEDSDANSNDKSSINIQILSAVNGSESSSSKPSNDVVSPKPRSRTAKEIMDMIENRQITSKNFNEIHNSLSKQKEQDEQRHEPTRNKSKKRRLGSKKEFGAESSIGDVTRNLHKVLNEIMSIQSSMIRTAVNAIRDGLDRNEINVEKAIAAMPDILLLRGPKQAAQTILALRQQLRKTFEDESLLNIDNVNLNDILKPFEIVLSFLKQKREQNQNENQKQDDTTEDHTSKSLNRSHSESNGILDVISGFFEAGFKPFSSIMNIFAST